MFSWTKTIDFVHIWRAEIEAETPQASYGGVSTDKRMLSLESVCGTLILQVVLCQQRSSLEARPIFQMQYLKASFCSYI